MWRILSTVLLIWISAITAEYVDIIQEYRETGDATFPEYIAVSFNMDAGQVNIQAFKNLHVPRDIPVFVGSSQGTNLWVDTTGQAPEEAYVSLLPKAEFLVREITASSINRRFAFIGTFEFGGEVFSISPDESDVMDRTVLPNSLRVANRHMVQRLDATQLPNMPFDIISGIPNLAPDDLDQGNAPSRQRREARYHKIFYTPEALAVADYTVFQKFERIYSLSSQKGIPERYDETVREVKAYITQVINGVDMRFMAINDSHSVFSTKLAGIFIATTSEAAPEKGSTINGGQQAGTYLKTFSDWLEPLNQVLIPFDYAVLITEDDLTGTLGNSVIGAAVSQSMCTDRSNGVVRHFDPFTGSQATAHLLAQAMGARRDGVENTCQDGTSYIMAPKAAPRSRSVRASVLKFSSCSVAEMIEFVKKSPDSSNCLQTEGRLSDPDVAIDIPPMNVLPGQRWTPEEQCRLLYGHDSYYCGGRTRDRELCSKMECFIPTRGVCFAYDDQHAADGTTCANKKMCLKKKCVRSASASYAQDDCIYGDYKGVLMDGRDCSAIMRSDCYDDVINDRCCATCMSLRADVEGCEFGDKAPTCDTIRPSECYNAQIAEKCCETCSRYKTKDPGCEYGDRSNKCMENVRSPKDCYDREPECCATCSRYRLKISGCEFGDRASWCNTITRDRCYMDSKICCKSCHDIRQLEYEGCEYGDHEASCGTIEPRHCYFLEKKCCETCRRVLTGPPGCEWGDELENCVENDCKHPDTRRKCCKFCGDFNARRTVSLNSVTPHMLDNEAHSIAYTKAPPLKIIVVCKGDQAPWCKDMDTFQCYISQDLCCDTCSKKRRPNNECPYGDHYEWCAGMDTSECRHRDKRESCCEKCSSIASTSPILPSTEVYTTPELMPSCLADLASWCPRIKPSDCYVSETTCCVTCRKYLRNVKGCHYGDRASWCAEYVRGSDHCQTEEMKTRCCQSCSQTVAPPTKSPSLLATATQALADITKAMLTRLTTRVPESTTPEVTSKPEVITKKPEVIASTDVHYATTRPAPEEARTKPPVRSVAASAFQPCRGPNKVNWCSNQDKSTCYKNHDICCELCSDAYTGKEGCEFGDRLSWCSNHVRSARDCYRHNKEGKCCGACAQYYTNNPDCPYGDRKENCDASRCNTEQGRRECCFTCAHPHETTITPDTTSKPRIPPVLGCQGDKVSWCSSLDPSFCYEQKTRKDFCCATCRKFWKENPGCEYGDRFIWCARISRNRCSELGADCCETCSKMDL